MVADTRASFFAAYGTLTVKLREARGGVPPDATQVTTTTSPVRVESTRSGIVWKVAHVPVAPPVKV